MIKKLLRNQVAAYYIAVLILIIPSILLAITEDYDFSTFIATLFIPTGLYGLFFLISPKPGVMILISIPLMIFGAFQIVLLYLFGGSIIAVDMFTNLLTTTVSEAGELLGNLVPAIITVCVIYIPLIIWGVFSIRSKERLSTSFRGKTSASSIVIILLGLCSGMISKEYQHKYHLFPVNIFYNMAITFDRWEKSNEYPETSKDFKFNVKRETRSNSREIYVLVIGEASRAANWELFGYNRNTNPLLTKRQGIIPFGNALTQNNATHKSVPLMLASVSAENFDDIYSRKSIITAFNEAGFNTIFITNQVPNNSLIDYFAAEADTKIDVNPPAAKIYSENPPDGAILPILRKEIEKDSLSNMLFVLHTYGSHFNFKMRYPSGFTRFTPDYAPTVNRSYKQEVLNSYDNSIAYTDIVLNDLISIIDSAATCSAVLYSADHGEDLMDDSRNRFLHASPTATYYQLHVACFTWFSEHYAELYPEKVAAASANRDKPINTSVVFNSMLDIADIKSTYLNQSRSVVNPMLNFKQRFYLSDHYKPILFYETGLKSQDIDKLKEHKITF